MIVALHFHLTYPVIPVGLAPLLVPTFEQNRDPSRTAARVDGAGANLCEGRLGDGLQTAGRRSAAFPRIPLVVIDGGVCHGSVVYKKQVEGNADEQNRKLAQESIIGEIVRKQ